MAAYISIDAIQELFVVETYPKDVRNKMIIVIYMR